MPPHRRLGIESTLGRFCRRTGGRKGGSDAALLLFPLLGTVLQQDVLLEQELSAPVHSLTLTEQADGSGKDLRQRPNKMRRSGQFVLTERSARAILKRWKRLTFAYTGCGNAPMHVQFSAAQAALKYVTARGCSPPRRWLWTNSWSSRPPHRRMKRRQRCRLFFWMSLRVTA